MITILNILFYLVSANADPISIATGLPKITKALGETRRILGGREVGDTRPYMVYLRPAPGAEAQIADSDWLCAGVIIHERYILTSAACIEDAKHFYVISGTHRWVPLSIKDEECINNGAKKAVWKCVPKSYFFDGNDFDNIRWMADDIAVVKVEDDFNFQRRIKGCDFIPKMIAYNNQSDDLEKPRTGASVAGWGSTLGFVDSRARMAANSPDLLETDVKIISKKQCKKRWEPRYHYIIDGSMICTKDAIDTDPATVCSEAEGNCKDMAYGEDTDEEEDSPTRKHMVDSKKLQVHTAAHTGSRRTEGGSGGFCENDHGGPLVVGHGKSAVVVGIVSACMTKDITHKCYGPFLYTSVWKNRHFVNCAVNKEVGTRCGTLLRSSKTQMVETVFNWADHPAGPAKNQRTDNKGPARKSNLDPGPWTLVFRGRRRTTRKTTVTTTTTTPTTTRRRSRQPCVRGILIRLQTTYPCRDV